MQSSVSLEATQDQNNLFFGSGDFPQFIPKLKLKNPIPTELDLPRAKEEPKSDVSQQLTMLQAQMAMISQLAINNNRPQQQDSVSAMLAFQLGEKLGAIGSNGEHTKTSLSSVSHTIETLSALANDMKLELEKTKIELKHATSGHSQLHQQLERVSQNLNVHGQSLAELRKDVHHHSEARTNDRSEATERMKSVSEEAKVSRERIVELEGVTLRLADEVRLLSTAQREERKELHELSKSHNEVSKKLNLLEANLQRDRETAAREVDRITKDVRELQRLTAVELRALDEKHQTVLAAVQTLRFEVQADLRKGPSLADGVLGVVLRTILPFMPNERIQAFVRFLYSKFGNAMHATARRFSILLLSLDLLHRAASIKYPELIAVLSSVLGLADFSRTTRFFLKIFRICFEVAMLTQLALILYDSLQHRFQQVRTTITDNRTLIASSLGAMVCLGVGGAVLHSNRRPIAGMNKRLVKQGLKYQRRLARQGNVAAKSLAKKGSKFIVQSADLLSSTSSRLTSQLPYFIGQRK